MKEYWEDTSYHPDVNLDSSSNNLQIPEQLTQFSLFKY